MNMYQLEKLNLLYDVCFDLFNSENYDYHAIDIKEVSNDFLTLSAKFNVTYYDRHEKEENYIIEFRDDSDETIIVRDNTNTIIKEYSREYNNAKSYIEKYYDRK